MCFSTLRNNDDLAEVVINGVNTGWVIRRDGALFCKQGRRASDNSSIGGYVVNGIRVNGMFNLRKRHRLVATYFVTNPRPGIFLTVDHINGDTTDNSACNLRWVDKVLNGLNTTSRHISPRGGKYKAQIEFKYKKFFLGNCLTEEAAKQMQNVTRQLVFDTYYLRRSGRLSLIEFCLVQSRVTK